MPDQAHDLRRLATDHDRQKAASAVNRPTLLAVIGGKGGVGVTTVVVDIANRLVKAGQRTILIDADPAGGNAALRCGIEERYTLADLLTGRRTWAEVVEWAPAGFGLAAGIGGPDNLGNRSVAALTRLPQLLNDRSIAADVVVMDVGNHFGQGVEPLCQMADATVMVTTTEKDAVLNAFTTIKALARTKYDSSHRYAATTASSLHLLINRVLSARDAAVVQYRIVRASRRFLGLNISIVDTPWVVRWAMHRSASGRIEQPAATIHVDRDTQHKTPERLDIGRSTADTLRGPWAREVVLN